ncbi:glycosyltransferase family 2 protein [Williamsia serinedens]|uniref:Glycosyl transferase family 2 n=1 Tax=Williamsia serinedens TaxID=391736 RepID=A0ABT1H3A0_9NOCA|nr:glycosyltransferase family 2 protein [Williamsia serinedens]MCP2160312.1 Glycosyl transferase family 2 [Williamsia serinedens]
MPTLSVVIPCHDEEQVIGDCLDRLVDQIEHIHEIVVVDNNSTDATADVVRDHARRHPQVRLITEDRQGLVYARNAGLDAATGEAIARIDADTMVGPRWAADIVTFLREDTEGRWSALCGRGEAYGLPYGDAMSRVKDRVGRVVPFVARRDATPGDVRSVAVLYGSNMTLRRSAWLAIRDRVAMRRDVFEDVDMGLCVTETGGANAFLPHLTVGVSPRRMETGVVSFARYMLCLPRTMFLHRRLLLGVGALTLYVPWVVVMHVVRLGLIRAWDPDTRSFRLRALLQAVDERGMP